MLMAIGTASLWLKISPTLVEAAQRLWLFAPRKARFCYNKFRRARFERRREWQRLLTETKKRESLKGTRWMRPEDYK
jgi:hypothetical protein